MARYPVKQLQDKNRNPFFPFNTLDSVLVDGTDQTLADVLDNIYDKDEINTMFATELSKFTIYTSVSQLPATARVGAVATVSANNVDTMYIFYQDDWHILTQKGDKGDTGNTGPQGPQGPQGIQGVPGVDGISPTVETSKSGKVTTITITDKYGPHIATVLDGEDGQGSGDMRKATYDTNENGIVDNAEKVNNHTVNADVPADAVFTDTTYTAGENITIENNVINATDTTYTAGENIIIEDNEISAISSKSIYLGNFSDYPQSNPLNLNDLEVGNYLIYPDVLFLYLSATYNGSTKTTYISNDTLNNGVKNLVNIRIDTKVEDVEITSDYQSVGTLFSTCIKYQEEIHMIRKQISIRDTDISCSYVDASQDLYLVNLGYEQTINGKKIFNILPESSIAPTADNQLANKKYVDDSLSNVLKGIIKHPQHIGSATTTVDVTSLKNSGVFAFMVIIRRWVATNQGLSVYIVSGINYSDYQAVSEIYKDNYPSTCSITRNTLTIDFNSPDGGGYSLIPLIKS